MPSVRDVLAVKGSQVHSVSPTERVLDAIRQMNQHKIGAVLVMQGGRVAGIFTERDVLRRVVGEERQPAHVTVGEVMTEDLICVAPDADLDEVATLMRNRKIRHVPVCDENGKLHGMISIGDLNAYHASNQEAQIHFLSEYIYGRV
ncbi:MAG: CBS domain-containing protein [Tepidisphaeraceae bacterium]